jgi:hypothetical protein
MMRVGLYKAVHVETLASQQDRMLLTSRKLLYETSCGTWRMSSEEPCAILGSGWESSVRGALMPGFGSW